MKNQFFLSLISGLAAGICGTLILVLSALIFIGGGALQYPWVLSLLVLLAVAVVFAVFIRKKFVPSVKYPLGKGVKFEPSFAVKVAKWLPMALCIAALFLSVIALARPRKAGKAIVPPAKGIDIILTIDTSGSMAALDFVPDRIGAAKKTAEDFVSKRSSDRIGVVIFAGAAMLQCPLTLDYFAVKEYINLINLDLLAQQNGTAIGDAIAVSSMHLKDSIAKSKVIILLTDGENNSGTVDPIAAAKAAAAYGIKIYTISVASGRAAQLPAVSAGIFGSASPVLQPPSPESEAALMQIAAETGGYFFRAKNNEELQNIYSRINELETTEFESVQHLNYKDNYYPSLVAALLLLICAFVLDKFIFIKIP